MEAESRLEEDCDDDDGAEAVLPLPPSILTAEEGGRGTVTSDICCGTQYPATLFITRYDLAPNFVKDP